MTASDETRMRLAKLLVKGSVGAPIEAVLRGIRSHDAEPPLRKSGPGA